MRRRDTDTCSLEGQLLFAELEGETLTLDCLLARPGEGTASPVTFAATFTRRTRSPHLAVELLHRWADDATPIAVTMSEGREGAKVEIAAPSGRVLLQPG